MQYLVFMDLFLSPHSRLMLELILPQAHANFQKNDMGP